MQKQLWNCVSKKILMCLFLFSTVFLCSCSLPQTKKTYTKTDEVMGTVLNETIYTSGEDETQKIKELLSKLEQDVLSWRIEDSEIAKINAATGSGQWISMSPELSEYVNASLQLAKDSQGAFDPTLGKISRLWDLGGEHPRVPKKSEIQKELKQTGYQKLEVKENEIKLPEGMSLDLGAVGKGIACDIAKQYIKQQDKIKGAVISVGGSIFVYGQKESKEPWKIAVQDPRGEQGEAMGVLSIEEECCISTSGDYEKYIEKDGKRYHHILDPSTGYPSESGLISVTIVSSNGLLSDGLSTACFVLGKEKGLKLAEKYGAEAIFIDKDYKVTVTEGAMKKFKILKETYQFAE